MIIIVFVTSFSFSICTNLECPSLPLHVQINEVVRNLNFTTVLLFISAVGSLRYCKMNSLALWTVLVQTFLYVSSVLSGEDFYSQLGVERSATTREIRRAFKKLALTEHPDKNIVSIPS